MSDDKGASFSAASANLYGYVLNDPINLSDPQGLAWVKNNTQFGVPYKPEHEEDGPLKICPSGGWCNVDGVYSPNEIGDQCVTKIPTDCVGEIDPEGNVSSVCLTPWHHQTPLTPEDLAKPEFQKNWPNPYTGDHWPHSSTCPE